MGFYNKPVFGKKKLSLHQMQDVVSQPDSDGVTRVFSKELWDDPEIGALLRECGMEPDDARNRVRSAEDWIAIFKQAEEDLLQRTLAYSREMETRHGYCRAIPLLVIGKPIYNGEHGAFLYGQMDLIGFDDWNVVWCALDERTRQSCGLPGFPGEVPAITDSMLKRVIGWKQRFEFLLESFGVTATGGKGGISREQYDAEKRAIRTEIIDTVAMIKPRIVQELHRLQGGPPHTSA